MRCWCHGQSSARAHVLLPGLNPCTSHPHLQEVEERLRPDMEARYRQLAAQGKHAAADQLLAGWTERVVRLACEALEGATAEAAWALGLPAVPGDAKLLQMLNAAAEKYAYHQGG